MRAMKKTVIRLSVVFLTVLCFCQLLFPIVYAVSAQVFSSPITSIAGTSVFIPIQIQNNPGIMGYHFIIHYDDSVCFNPKVTKGTVTEDGMLDDNTAVAESGDFDVIWTSTEDEKTCADTLAFQTKNTSVKETTIELEYIQEDTFNSQWEDVALVCEPIVVSFVQITETESVSAVQSRSPTYNDIIIAMESAQEASGDADTYVELINSAVFQLTGQKDYYQNVEQVQDAYQEAVVDRFVEKVTNTITEQEIQDIIDSAVESIGVDSLENIPTEKQEEFVRTVEASLAEKIPDMQLISDDVSSATALQAIQKVQDIQNTPRENKQESRKSYTFIIIPIVVLVVICSFVAILIYRKKSNGGENNND